MTVAIKRITALMVLAVTLIVTGFSGVGEAFAATAYAEENITYSSVLDDLQKDETFNTDNYPDVSDDYSLQVFNIAESTTGELLVYVYQPAAKTKFLVATQINISRQDINVEDATFEVHDLTLISSAGVFQKYRVEEFELEVADIRTYNIASISRRFYASLGDVAPKDETGNTAQTVAFDVGQVWEVKSANGTVSYFRKDYETIKIEDKYVGSLRYFAGWSVLFFHDVDSHYLAFTANRKIDDLLSAEVKFTLTAKERLYIIGIDTYTWQDGGSISEKVTINAADCGGVTAKGLFSEQKNWYLIQRVDDFIADNSDLTEEAKNNINDKEWVIRFCETSRTKADSLTWGLESFFDVSNVSVLRLEFKADGKYFNLGVVDNEQTGKGTPDNVEPFNFFVYVWTCIVKFFKGEASLEESLIAIVVILIVVAVIPLLAAIFPTFGQILITIFKAIGKGIWWLLRGIWWVISAPFKFILNHIRNKKD